LKVALAQLNPVVGDIDMNTAGVVDRVRAAAAAGADLVLLPELATVGYPPKDLLLKRSFVEANVAALHRVAESTAGVIAAVGYVQPYKARRGKGLSNSLAVCGGGRVLATYAKVLLPTYDVFDELRYFDAGSEPVVAAVEAGGKTVKLGLSICEDLWSDDEYFDRHLHRGDPIADLASKGADVIVNIGASPFSLGKPQRRLKLFGDKARQIGLPLVYVNQVGGNDDLVFDGASGAFNAEGRLIAQAKSFDEDLLLVDLGAGGNRIEPLPEGVEAVHDALVLGTRDYVNKCGFEAVVIGVSGGIDSAVTAAIAVEALGPDRVHLVAMPSKYSSNHSLTDSQALADALGAPMRTIPIEDIHNVTEQALRPHFEGRPSDVTEENIQARARGQVLMALSNKFGRLVLTTGNKSELAVGYCTMYGDMCGGLAVISDVPKTMVYRLAEHINERAGREMIPRNTITKPPSAELKPDQTDQDSLPPYEVLDAILERYVEREESAADIVAAGFDEDVVRDVIRRVDLNEYKRKQAAPGLKVTSRAFGSGRRMPIAARHGWGGAGRDHQAECTSPREG
jgi:NAD+ synthetase